ncbi:MAG: NAD(P)/FAD-dependent oxidoreductase [Pseudomonadota bacterium]
MHYDTLIIGAGAAGMMCAAHAARTGRRVLIIDHAKAPGEKIRISGGGRCNFTNLGAAPENFISANPHFCKSALARYTQWDFLDLVGRHGIAWHEKTLGQLFCDGSAREIIAMLLAEMDRAGAELRLLSAAERIEKATDGFRVALTGTGTKSGEITCRHLVIATGGKSIPKMGATGFAYQVAEQFGHAVTKTRPALVPLTFDPSALAWIKPLAGVAVDGRVRADGPVFEEALLFTHRGLSGPAILQASSYWREGEEITLTIGGSALFETLKAARQTNGRRDAATALAEVIPKRLADHLCSTHGLTERMGDLSDKRLEAFACALSDWRLSPMGSEGYRTAEVTLGGVATDGLDARTMESRHVPDLFFIGEGVDVTGWLGGYNFQWAWSSGWAAGTEIASRH